MSSSPYPKIFSDPQIEKEKPLDIEPSTPARILLIDDEPAILRLYQQLLTRKGYQVVAVEEGKKAEQILEEEEFDAIVADILLPGLNGIELLALLREKGYKLPVILITGAPGLETAIQAIKLGAYEYLTKPIDNQQFLKAVERAVAFQRLVKEKERLEQENQLYQKRLEEQNQRLEDLVWERTRKLEQSLEELKRTQDKLIQSEKMASIGALTAGITHEINNPMAYVKSNLEQIKEYAQAIILFLQELFQRLEPLGKNAQGELKQFLDEIYQKAEELDIWYILSDCEQIISETQEGVERVIGIIRDLRQFTHPNHDVVGEARLEELLETAINLTWNAIKYKAELIREYAQLPPLKCYPRLLTQVFVNLLVNACQAIEKQGKIWVRTFKRDGYYCAQVEDTGCGISKENLNKIFDPFFTTKEVNKGTGLGLSISYGIVQKHQGKIEVESEPGKGTIFTVKIPENFQPQEKAET